MHFAEVGGVSGPVVHFNVDVCMNVAVPEGSVGAVVPDALQVAGSMDGSVEVGADGHVASILEVEAFQEETFGRNFVVSSRIVELDEVFGGLFADSAEGERNAVHQFAVFFHVGSKEDFIVLGRGSCNASLYLFGNLLGSFTAHAAGLGGVVVGGSSHHDVHPVCTNDMNTLAVGCHGCTVICQDFEGGVVCHHVEFSIEGSLSVSVSHRAGVDEFVGSIGDVEGQFVISFCFIVCHKHLVGGRNEVVALVGCCFVAALVVHTAHTVDDVEVAVVCLDRFAVVFE